MNGIHVPSSGSGEPNNHRTKNAERMVGSPFTVRALQSTGTEEGGLETAGTGGKRLPDSRNMDVALKLSPWEPHTSIRGYEFFSSFTSQKRTRELVLIVSVVFAVQTFFLVWHSASFQGQLRESGSPILAHSVPSDKSSEIVVS